MNKQIENPAIEKNIENINFGTLTERDEAETKKPADDLLNMALKSGGIPLPCTETPFEQSARIIFGKLNETGNYYQVNGIIHEIIKDHFEPVSPHGFRSRIEELGKTVVISKDHGHPQLKLKRPSVDTCKALMAAKAAKEILPKVLFSTSAPILIARPDGTFNRVECGYCADAEIYVFGEHPHIEITAQEAAVEIDDLLRDFKFNTAADKNRARAFILTVALRMGGFIKDKRCPLFLLEAERSQSGKSFLAFVVAAIYGLSPYLISPRKGGVGSFDESVMTAMTKGNGFILLDNLRGTLNSMMLESILTAAGPVATRLPGRTEQQVDPSRFFFSATSNGLETTADFTNRMIIVGIQKQPDEYMFHQWPEGELLDHIKKNQNRLLAGIHAIILDWANAGSPVENVCGHDFRNWHRIAQAIITRTWSDAGDIIDTRHGSASQRMSDPRQIWLRKLCVDIKHNEWMSATQLAEVCADKGISVPGSNDAGDVKSVAKRIGIIMKSLLGEVDEIIIEDRKIMREEKMLPRLDNKGFRNVILYKFSNDT